VPIFIPDLSFSTLIAERKVKLSLTVSPCDEHEWTLSRANTEYSIHRVRQKLSTASIEDCQFSLHSQDYQLTPECCFSFWRASLQDLPTTASSPWEIKGTVTSSHSHGCELPQWWIESQHLALLQSTATKYSNLAWSWPPSASPNLLNHGLQVYLSYTIAASKCLSKLDQSRPPSACLSYTISDSKSISKLGRSRPPSSPPNWLDHGLQVHLWVTRSRVPNASPSSFDYGLQVVLATVPDHHFRSGSGSKQNLCQIGCPGRQ